MNLKRTITGSLLLAIGMILHQITPPIFLGIKPDFLLSMMFIALILSEDFKTSLILGITAGILTALTTGFPGGQLPNLVDKIVTSIIIYYVLSLIPKKVKNQYKLFITLFISVVLPAVLINTLITIIFYRAFIIAQKYTSLQ